MESMACRAEPVKINGPIMNQFLGMMQPSETYCACRLIASASLTGWAHASFRECVVSVFPNTLFPSL
jgi:hypothetical protein